VLASSEGAEARLLLAECLLEQKRSSEALAALEAVRPEPVISAWWVLYARALSAEKRHAEACEAAERAHQEHPASVTLRLQVLAAAGRHPELIELSRRTLASETSAPALAEIQTLLGLSLDALGRSHEAAQALHEAVRLEPRRVDANCGLGMALLRVGDYESGFRHYEYRQKGTGRARLGVPAWRGESLDGKHLVVRSEQGYGDTLQFARFLAIAGELAQQTTFFAPAALVRLLRSNPALGAIATGHSGFGLGDCQTLVMSLPLYLGLSARLGVASAPYLFPEPELVDTWRSRLRPGRKIALAWQGNPHFAGDPWRSMPFEHFGPLIERFGARAQFLSLQKHTGREQLEASPFADRVLDLGAEIDGAGDAFVDSLAVLSEVDLFVTTDNGLAHLACAGGIPTWLLLGTVPDWRWGLTGATTSWYPSARLFRQSSGGDWGGVISAICDELERELAGTPRRAP
jgi:tetratricopeptide (TPR) repeat protein